MNINKIIGKCFKGKNGELFGVIRSASLPYPEELKSQSVIAEDECGNYFLIDRGAVSFWDHETGDSTLLANSKHEFISCCCEPIEEELDPRRVESVWIDPDFAKKYGL
ncbi:MAG: hypothetical protein AB8B84_16235 [Granulosicoccus sp.]